MAINYKIPQSIEQKLIEIEKLSKIEKFALDAYLISKLPASEKVITAYELSRPRDSQANRQSIYMQARKWITTKKCKYYIEQRKEELFNIEWKSKRTDKPTSNGEPKGDETSGEGYKRSKTETIEELNEIASNTNDPKLRAEILIKISDLEGWKKEKEVTDDDTIRYYLPQRCNSCPLYQSAKLTQSRK